jgi:hypothetical protein
VDDVGRLAEIFSLPATVGAALGALRRRCASCSVLVRSVVYLDDRPTSAPWQRPVRPRAAVLPDSNSSVPTAPVPPPASVRQSTGGRPAKQDSCAHPTPLID